MKKQQQQQNKKFIQKRECKGDGGKMMEVEMK